RGHVFLSKRDALRRLTDTRVIDGSGPPQVVARIVYGEGQKDDVARNLRGRVFQTFDGAGVVTNVRYDFKGNTTETTRQFAADPRGTIDWDLTVPLEPEVHRTTVSFDALNRPIATVHPDG